VAGQGGVARGSSEDQLAQGEGEVLRSSSGPAGRGGCRGCTPPACQPLPTGRWPLRCGAHRPWEAELQLHPTLKLSFETPVGPQARVVFTSVALSNPHILLLDEPTNHLDMQVGTTAAAAAWLTCSSVSLSGWSLSAVSRGWKCLAGLQPAQPHEEQMP